MNIGNGFFQAEKAIEKQDGEERLIGKLTDIKRIKKAWNIPCLMRVRIYTLQCAVSVLGHALIRTCTTWESNPAKQQRWTCPAPSSTYSDTAYILYKEIHVFARKKESLNRENVSNKNGTGVKLWRLLLHLLSVL